MSEAAKKLLEEALRLPAAERSRLGARLLESVHDEPAEVVETAWREEIQRRLEDVEEGRVELLDGDVVLRELRAKYPRR